MVFADYHEKIYFVMLHSTVLLRSACTVIVWCLCLLQTL